jgi:uncharacterized membrane protein
MKRFIKTFDSIRSDKNRPPGRKKRPLWMHLLMAGSIIWCGMIILPALLDVGSSGSRLFASGIRTFFSPICHQDPSRSICVAGKPLAVCARCAGIYLGFILAVAALWMFRRRPGEISRPVMIGCLAPMALEAVSSKILGLGTGQWIRAASGIPAGALAAWGVWIALTELFQTVNIQPLKLKGSKVMP